MDVARDESVFMGAVYMFVLTALLFWIPVVGPLVAGFVGGRKAGSAGRGLVAAIVPAVLAGVLVYLVVNAFPAVAPWLAAILAGAFTLWLIVQSGLVVLGGVLGGMTAGAEGRRSVPTVR